MSEKALALADTLLKQEEILSELLSVNIRQREALRAGRLSEVQGLMSELRHVSVRCQAIETKRSRTAEDLAEELGTEAVISSIAAQLPEAEAGVLDAAAQKLMGTVSKLKTEMSVLERMMEEAKLLNEMMISEWRRLSEKSYAPGSSGGFDTRI
jgi:FlgN protein.